MRHFCLSTLILFSFTYISFAQTATVKGTIKDGRTGEFLDGANVVQPPSNGTTTDIKGNYELNVSPGEVTLVISYLGMSSDSQRFTVKERETKTLDVKLGGGSVELQTVVVGQSRLGVAIQKITQTVDVIKPRMLESNNITNLQQAVTKIPGVTILDGQMSIRGGSGYAYGSGSRVLLFVDEMPLMSADRGEIKWSFIPTESIEQVELIKGASTVQYGASALNGVLNVNTGWASDTPTTKFTLYYEGIGKPPVDSFKWWKRDGKFLENPNNIGFSFVHKQKFGDFDFVLTSMMQGYQSHLNQEYEHFIRFSPKIRWQPHNLKRLTIELSSNLMYRKSGSQFYWQDAGHPYLTASGVDIDERYFYAYLDPKIRFLDKKNNQHKLLTRIFRQRNLDGQNNFWQFRTEYQFRHDFGRLVRLQCGINNTHSMVNDGTLGKHQTDDGGIFALAKLDWKWLSADLGVRDEYERLDSVFVPQLPIFSAGLNFEAKKNNNIRLSFGQSNRIPSLAERFVVYQLASIAIRPNPSLLTERGFTAELGYKRTIKIGNWNGYVDASLFWTEFRNMIEFTFGLDLSHGVQFYFQPKNVSRARIFGWEVSAYGEGKIGPVDFTTMFGYTYYYGVDLNDTLYGANKRNNNIGTFLLDAFRHFSIPTAKSDGGWDSLTAGMLRYRNPHTFKMDFDFIFINKIHFGTSMQYYGYMTKIDKIFEIAIKDINKIRADSRNKGDFIWDLRAGYDINRNLSLNFLVKNVMNSNYAIRVAKPNAPRSYTVQLIVNFGGRTAATAQRNAAQRMAAM